MKKLTRSRSITAHEPAETPSSGGLRLPGDGPSRATRHAWALGMLPAGLAFRALTGFAGFPSMLVATVAAGLGCSYLFSEFRQRPPDASWLPNAFLLACLLPPATPAWIAALAMGFGGVFGSLVIGGAGRSLVNPALLGAMFSSLAYAAPAVPPLPESPGGLAGFALALGVTAAIGILGGGRPLLSVPAAALLTLTALACAVFLAGAGPATAWLSAGLLRLPEFAVITLVVLTDPGTQARTLPGAWLAGGLFALMVCVLLVLRPAHPAPVLAAALMIQLLVPLLDVAVRDLRWPRRGAGRGGW